MIGKEPKAIWELAYFLNGIHCYMIGDEVINDFGSFGGGGYLIVRLFEV